MVELPSLEVVQCYSLVGVVVFGESLDSVILEDFSKLNDSVIV